jgi:hypothetical protein
MGSDRVRPFRPEHFLPKHFLPEYLRQKHCRQKRFWLAVWLGLTLTPMGGHGAIAGAVMRADGVPRVPSIQIPASLDAPHNRRLWLLRTAPPDRIAEHGRTLVEAFLKLGRNAAAIHYAEALLEHAPRRLEAHLDVAGLFARYRQCGVARGYFRKLRRLAIRQRHSDRLREMRRHCGHVWTVRYDLEWRTGRTGALIDAPRAAHARVESGSLVDGLCLRLRGDACPKLQVGNLAIARAG